MFLPSDYDDYYEPPFCIEIREMGMWFAVEETFETLDAALKYGSDLCYKHPEDAIQIIDRNCKII
jgi:hypothetical protein